MCRGIHAVLPFSLFLAHSLFAAFRKKVSIETYWWCASCAVSVSVRRCSSHYHPRGGRTTAQIAHFVRMLIDCCRHWVDNVHCVTSSETLTAIKHFPSTKKRLSRTAARASSWSTFLMPIVCGIAALAWCLCFSPTLAVNTHAHAGHIGHISIHTHH